MDLRQIQYVEAVARHANFTRAAAELHVAQPALSHAVRRLEGELGVRLFERTSRRVTLTDAGQSFLALATRVTRDVDRLAEEMREYAGGVRGRLRLSAWYHVEPRLGQFLRDFVAIYPSVDISVSELSTPEALDQLRAGDVDLATVLFYPGLDMTSIEHAELRMEPYVLAVRDDHPLAKRDSIQVADMAGLAMIATREGTALRRCLDRILAGHDERPRIVIETNELAAAVAFVSAGLGSTLLTPTIVRAISQSLILVPIVDAIPFELRAAWRRGPVSTMVRRAIDLVLEHRVDAMPQSVSLGAGSSSA